MTDQQSLRDAAETADLARLERAFGSVPQDQRRDTIQQIAKEAARSGHPQILEFCFDHGFSVPDTSFNGEFYETACDGESPAVFQVLLKHGFKLNTHESKYVGDALVCATYRGNIEFARFLLENGQTPSTHRTMYPGELEAMTYAIAGPHPSHDMLVLLLQHGAEIRESGAAIAAAEVGRLDDLKLLVAHGADIEETDYWWVGQEDEPYESEGTALYRACRKGQVETASYLLNIGANGRTKDCAGTSCYAIARIRGYCEAVAEQGYE